jgi:DNA-binding IclR family transcriptional regulator
VTIVASVGEADRDAAVQSVDRAISILEILARDGWSGVTDIARELDVHKSTVSRVIATLERRGVVTRHTASRKYRLGPALARLASGVRDTFDLAEVARPICERLSEDLDETVNLAVVRDDEVVNVSQASLSSAIVTVDWVGHHSPLHVTASGKVALAFGDAARRSRILAGPLPALTPASVTDPDRLRRSLEEVRRRGYAVTRGELETGLVAVAAPILDADGLLVAAIVASGPEYRLTGARIPAIAAGVVAAAEAVSRRLGRVVGGRVSHPPTSDTQGADPPGARPN